MTVAAELEIRPASDDDVEVVAEIGARTFRDTFESDNDPDDLGRYIASAFALDRVAAELADPLSVVYLARLGEEVVGYCKIKARKAPGCVQGPHPVELERLYLDRRAIGKGHGAALMSFCLETARKKGFETIWLGVWEMNHRALAFYRRWGFVEVGSQDFVVGTDVQTDLIMERSLSESRGS